MNKNYLDLLLSHLKIGLNKNSGKSNGTLVIKGQGSGLKYNYKYINFKLNIRSYFILKLIIKLYKTNLLLISYSLNTFFNPFLLNYIKSFEGAFFGQYINSELNYNFPGKVIKLKNAVIGEKVHLIEIKPFCGSSYVRSAQTCAKVLNQLTYVTHLSLPSNKQINLNNNLYCIIGIVSKASKIKKYKSGQSRFLNFRPQVRGLAMNCVDHPMGGGRGKSKSNKIPRTPYGKIIKK